MPTDFTTDELDTIGRFVGGFCQMYGSDDFTILEASKVRSVPPHDPTLGALAVKLIRDEELFSEFCFLVGRWINNRLGRNFEVQQSHAGFPGMLGFTEGTTILLIRPYYGMTMATTSVFQARERLLETRVFVVDENGINIHLDMDPERVFPLPAA